MLKSFINSITPDLFNDFQVYRGWIFGRVDIDTVKEVVQLSNLDPKSLVETTYCFFIVEEDKLEELKQLIREKTNQFTTIKGGMYSYALHDFEGSF